MRPEGVFVKGVVSRGIATLVILVVWGALGGFFTTVSPLVSGPAASLQFENSNQAYVQSAYLMRWFDGNLPGWVPFLVFGFIFGLWASLLLRKPKQGTLLLIIGMTLLGLSQPASAYYDKTDYSEAYFILPNESAFFIPDVGATRDSQAKFGSMEYLEANKIAAKRFLIPHARFSGSGSLWSDYFVPSGRLIVIDRTPYNREWVGAAERGTSAKNESFPCQSSEGLNITAEVAIATSVSEDNAARFLYWFGVKPPQGDRSNPAVIFTSVYYGKSLAEVMDSVARGKIQSLVCHEIGARTFENANKDVNAMLDAIEKNATAWLATKGITLDYIGWAGTLSFDKDVQQAVNDRYTAEKIAPVLSTLQAKAVLDAMTKWNGALPSNMSGLWMVPSNLVDGFASWFSGKK